MTNHRIEMALDLRRAARSLAQQEQAMKELADQLDKAKDEDYRTVHELGMTALESLRQFPSTLRAHSESLLSHINVHIEKHTS